MCPWFLGIAMATPFCFTFLILILILMIVCYFVLATACRIYENHPLSFDGVTVYPPNYFYPLEDNDKK
jgi:hypothetical protein